MRYYEYMIAEGKKDMSNFKVGDKVRVVDNHCGHGFEIGDVVVLEKDCGTGWKVGSEEDSWWLVEREFEPYVELDMDSMSEFKFPSGPTVWDQDIGDEGIKKASSINYNNVSKPAHYNHKVDYVNGDGINSDGGPSAYYDFHEGWRTWNDFADYKARQQWKEHSFHLGNVGKVLCRWGDKSGTSKSYDARKIVYSGLRVLLMLEGKENVRAYLENLLEDNQFKD